MGQEIEEIKKILLKYNPTIKEELDIGLVESKSIYDLEEFLNVIVNKELNGIDTLDIVLIVEQLRKLEEKKMRLLKESMESEE